MLRYVVVTYILHICDMFDEMSVMTSQGIVKSFLNYLHLYHCFNVNFHFWKFHKFLGSGLCLGPKKWHKS